MYRTFRVARQRLLLQQRLYLQQQQQHLQQQQQHFLEQRASFSSSYDIFKKLKDPPESNEAKELARKPSDKVLRLVDEVMSLTLIEAADLCDLCQEKLAQRGGGPAFNAAMAAGRAPFPHPSALFAGTLMQNPMGLAAPGFAAAGHPAAAAAAAPAPGAAAEASAAADASSKPKAPEEEKKASFSLRLLGFDAAKKVAVVKEVRALTALGLREAKELVEQAPKILKKAVPAAEAEALKAKLEAAGAQVALE